MGPDTFLTETGCIKCLVLECAQLKLLRSAQLTCKPLDVANKVGNPKGSRGYRVLGICSPFLNNNNGYALNQYEGTDLLALISEKYAILVLHEMYVCFSVDINLVLRRKGW